MAKSKALNEARLATAVATHGVEDLEAELRAARDEIERRAYELFETHGFAGMRALDDWLRAERDLFWEPQATIIEHDDAYVIEIAMPGAKPSDLEVQVTGHSVLVKSVNCLNRRGDGEKLCVDELPQGRAFRLFELPGRLDREKTSAELRDGLLRVTVPRHPEEPARVVPVAA
jgi:HSP20 family protein